ncbi:alpha/beta hydrolase, partial [Akkermansia sp.]
MNLMRMLKPGKWKILSALLAGALALACVQCSVRSLVYLPPQPKDKTVYLEKRAAWEPHRRTFHHNGAQLSGWLIEKKGQPLLVYYGGNAMDISMMLPYLDRFPHAKLLVNYRGYGLSTGTPTEQNIMGDSLAILDSVLKETGRTPDDVILVGQSLGSGVATQIASVRNVKKLVLLV